MNYYQTLILSIPLILATPWILFFTYTLQIKEYRWDRFRSHLGEKGLKSILFPNRFLFPAKSIRNLLILLISFFALYQIENYIPYPFELIVIPLAPFAVIISVFLTEPLAQIKRRSIISRAKRMVQNSNAEFIGITGSYGKTSTKDFMYEILNSTYTTAKTLKNQNSAVGAALSVVSELKKNTSYFVCEMGAYKKGEIKEMTDFVKPKYGILTGIGNQHLDLFGSQANIIFGKKELLDSLPNDGIAYVNMDSDYFENLIQNLECKVVTYSLQNSEAKIYFKEFNSKGLTTNGTVKYKNTEYKIKGNIIGTHFYLNMLPCIALAHDIGVPKKNIESVISQFKNSYSSLSTHKGFRNATYILNAKNSNVNGFIGSLETLSKTNAKNKIIITKGIIELGNQKDTSYRKIIELAANNDIKILTLDPKFRELDPHEIVKLLKSEKEILKFIDQHFSKDTCALIEGKFKDTFIKKLELEK